MTCTETCGVVSRSVCRQTIRWVNRCKEHEPLTGSDDITLSARDTRRRFQAQAAEWLRSAARFPSHEDWKDQDPQEPKSVWYHTDAQFSGFRIVHPLVEPSEKEKKEIWDSGLDLESDNARTQRPCAKAKAKNKKLVTEKLAVGVCVQPSILFRIN